MADMRNKRVKASISLSISAHNNVLAHVVKMSTDVPQVIPMAHVTVRVSLSCILAASIVSRGQVSLNRR